MAKYSEVAPLFEYARRLRIALHLVHAYRLSCPPEVRQTVEEALALDEPDISVVPIDSVDPGMGPTAAVQRRHERRSHQVRDAGEDQRRLLS